MTLCIHQHTQAMHFYQVLKRFMISSCSVIQMDIWYRQKSFCKRSTTWRLQVKFRALGYCFIRVNFVDIVWTTSLWCLLHFNHHENVQKTCCLKFCQYVMPFDGLESPLKANNSWIDWKMLKTTYICIHRSWW